MTSLWVLVNDQETLRLNPITTPVAPGIVTP